MKVLLCTILLLVCTSLLEVGDATTLRNTATYWRRNRLLRNEKKREMRRLAELRREVVNNGCDTNICFALDGSRSVTQAEYRAQKDFVDLIIAITATDERVNLCAVQYDSKRRSISRLTGNRDKFLQRLHKSRLAGGRQNVANGIQFPVNQLRWRFGDAKKIVLLGKGISRVDRRSKRMARRFRKRGGDICAVAVGPSDLRGLKAITGDAGRVLTLDDFFELSEIIVSIVNDVCELDADTPSDDTAAEDDEDKKPPVEDEEEKEPPVEDEGGKETPVKDEEDKEAPVKDEEDKEAPVEEEGEKETPVENEDDKQIPVEDEEDKVPPVEDEGGNETPVEGEEYSGTPVEDDEEGGKSIEDEVDEGTPVDDGVDEGTPVEEETSGNYHDPYA